MSQNFSSLALTVWYRQCVEDISTKDELFKEIMNNKGLCGTAPAKLGLLTTRSSGSDTRRLKNKKVFHIVLGEP